MVGLKRWQGIRALLEGSVWMAKLGVLRGELLRVAEGVDTSVRWVHLLQSWGRLCLCLLLALLAERPGSHGRVWETFGKLKFRPKVVGLGTLFWPVLRGKQQGNPFGGPPTHFGGSN